MKSYRIILRIKWDETYTVLTKLPLKVTLHGYGGQAAMPYAI